MDNIPRFIFYCTGVPIVSGAFTLLTNELIAKVNDPTYVGMLFLLGFGLVYMNITFIVGRRFMRRLNGASLTPYIFAVLVALPPLLWVGLTGADLGDSKLVFMLTVVFGCALGAYFSHRAGLKAQIKLQENLRQYEKQDEKTPEELKHSHENLNKN